jgi:hypothetical protein
MRMLIAAVFVLLLASPSIAAPRTIRDFQDALATMRAFQAASLEERTRMLADERGRIERATFVLEEAAAIRQSVIEASLQATKRYGRPFLCNLDEDFDSEASTEELIQGYVEKIRGLRLASAGKADEAVILDVALSLAILQGLLDENACPAQP